MRVHGSQWISNKINIRHPGQLKKWKSWELFWSYQLNSTANPAHLPQNWAKLAESAVLFSLQNGSQDFDFFICHGCRLFISCEIHYYLCPQIFWVYYFSLRQCENLFSCILSFVARQCALKTVKKVDLRLMKTAIFTNFSQNGLNLKPSTSRCTIR